MRLPYEPDDDDAANVFIDAALRSQDLATWRALNAPEYVLQTHRVLRAMRGRVGLTFTHRNADIDVAKSKVRSGALAADEYAQLLDEFKRWKKSATVFQQMVSEQIGRTRDRARVVSGDDTLNDMRELVFALAMAVDEHRRRQDNADYEPTEADRVLWARLVALSLPADGGRVPLSEVVRQARERKPDRRTSRR